MTQKGKVTCLKSHRLSMVEPQGSEPGKPDEMSFHCPDILESMLMLGLLTLLGLSHGSLRT